MEDITNADYWRTRLLVAQRSGELHQSIFRCPIDRWREIEAKHRSILARTIKPNDSILDAGCGWGRLLDLLPAEWTGDYAGVDLSPDFIEMARATRRTCTWGNFYVGDLRKLPAEVSARQWDFAVLISVRPMVQRNLGGEVWEQMEAELRRVATRLLFLEYDTADDGVVA